MGQPGACLLGFARREKTVMRKTGVCMMDMRCVVFVRGKKPTFDVIDLAEECGIVLLTTDERMYAACGKLYAAGLTGGSVLPK